MVLLDEGPKVDVHGSAFLSDKLAQLQRRARGLLDELQAYQDTLRSHQNHHLIEIRVFKRGVESELKSLERIIQNLESIPDFDAEGAGEEHNGEPPQLHALRSSNLPFYEAVWSVAKSYRGIIALGKRMFPKTAGTAAFDSSQHSARRSSQPVNSVIHPKIKGVLVDVVADNGLQWVKVSTMTEKRLLFEMAKEGWEAYEDAHDSPGDDSDPGEAGRQLELVRVAQELSALSRHHRVRFRHPQVIFALPNIREGSSPDVDSFLTHLRAVGVEFRCGTAWHVDLPTRAARPFDRLLPAAETLQWTDRVNLDCTILLALVSDISHMARPQLLSNIHERSTNYHSAILRQIENEERAPLLPTSIYPLLRGRALECTSHASQRMQEIVRCMGTASERNRADILLGCGAHQGRPGVVLRQALSENSCHMVPEEAILPVIVAAVNVDAEMKALEIQREQDYLSLVMFRTMDGLRLSPINSSVFLYGWMHRTVTLTSNRVVAGALLKAVNDLLDQDEARGAGLSTNNTVYVGPQIHVCDIARSLIGKARPK